MNLVKPVGHQNRTDQKQRIFHSAAAPIQFRDIPAILVGASETSNVAGFATSEILNLTLAAGGVAVHIWLPPLAFETDAKSVW